MVFSSRGAFSDIVWEALSTVTVEKEVVLKNPRLGLMHAVLMVGAVAVSLYNIVYSQPWWRLFEPSGTALELWGTQAGDTPSEEHYCTNRSLSDLFFRYDDNFIYSPSSCAHMPPGEKFRKNAGRLQFPTYSMDQYIWTNVGEEECAEEQEACDRRGGTMQRDGEACVCTFTTEFLVMHAERNLVWLNHGYKVDTDVSGNGVQTGRSTRPYDNVERFSENNRKEGEDRLEQGILTVIKSKDGSDCTVGGKSQWKSEPIHGTLEEWLACGGVSLDDRSNNLVGDYKDEAGPAVRITGANIEIVLTYSNFYQGTKYGGVVCNLVVHVIPVWNSFQEVAYTQLPTLGSAGGESSYRYRYAYGITVSMKVEGSFGFVDWTLLFTAIMANMVLLTLPYQAVRLVALYGAGATSKVYRRAQSTDFDIHDYFHGFCARVLGHAQTFRDLADSFNHRGEACVDREDLRKLMLEAFEQNHRPANGEFDSTWGSKAARILAHVTDNGEKVHISEFVLAATDNETMHVGDAMTFFDENRKRGILERIFGDRAFDPARMKVQPNVSNEVSGGVVVVPGSGVGSAGSSPDKNAAVHSPGSSPDKNAGGGSGDGVVLKAKQALTDTVQQEIKRAVAIAIQEELDQRPRPLELVPGASQEQKLRKYRPLPLESACGISGFNPCVWPQPACDNQDADSVCSSRASGHTGLSKRTLNKIPAVSQENKSVGSRAAAAIPYDLQSRGSSRGENSPRGSSVAESAWKKIPPGGCDSASPRGGRPGPPVNPDLQSRWDDGRLSQSSTPPRNSPRNLPQLQPQRPSPQGSPRAARRSLQRSSPKPSPRSDVSGASWSDANMQETAQPSPRASPRSFQVAVESRPLASKQQVWEEEGYPC